MHTFFIVLDSLEKIIDRKKVVKSDNIKMNDVEEISTEVEEVETDLSESSRERVPNGAHPKQNEQ